MNKFNKIDRKTFIKSAGVAAVGISFGSWRAVAGENLNPASIRLGHITDTLFIDPDDKKRTDSRHPSRMISDAFALADDIVEQFKEASVDAIIHGGNLIQSGKNFHACPALEWLNSRKIPFRLTMGENESALPEPARKEFISIFSKFGFLNANGYYSYDAGGFHFIHLSSAVEKDVAQQKWIDDDLKKSGNAPTIVVHHNLSRESLKKLFGAHNNVLLALGGGFANGAEFDGGMLMLNTCSPVAYPCGARIVKIDASQGQIAIESKFIQTRRLEFVDESFHLLRERDIVRLGNFKGRRFTADPAKKPIEPVAYRTNPALAPRIGSDSNVTIALVSDTHLCRDRFLTGEQVTQYMGKPSEYKMTGHFNEKGSKAIFADILEQVAQGRHRVEFFDEVFDRNPKSENNFIEAPVDTLLLTGDLTEHGMRDEALDVIAGLDALPEKLRQNTMVTPGNHDMFRGDVIKTNSAGSRKPFADLYKNYIPPDGNLYYSVQLADWLSLIVLDSVIPTYSQMGLIQDQIDWLEDQIAARQKQTVIVACHHPTYKISQVPRIMTAYMKTRSHETYEITSAKTQMRELFAKNNNVKLVLSGHAHGTCTDQFRKTNPEGKLPDDAFTTHIQIPCTIEYPNGYRLLKVSRPTNDAVAMNYITAYTRLSGLRTESARAFVFNTFGTDIKKPGKYEGGSYSINEPEKIERPHDRINSMDLLELNVRGYKDGSAHNGRGNSSKGNINGKIEVSI